MLPGIHDEVVAQVSDAGYGTAQAVLDAGLEGLTAHGLDEETAQAVLEAAQAVRAEEEAQAAQAEADAAAAAAAAPSEEAEEAAQEEAPEPDGNTAVEEAPDDTRKDDEERL